MYLPLPPSLFGNEAILASALIHSIVLLYTIIGVILAGPKIVGTCSTNMSTNFCSLYILIDYSDLLMLEALNDQRFRINRVNNTKLMSLCLSLFAI